MYSRAASGFVATAFVLMLSAAPPAPAHGFLAQEEPATEPGPSRAPSYERPAPPTALRLAGSPPAAGDPIIGESLSSPGVIPGPFVCPTGRNRGEFVGEGYIFKVTGPCQDGATIAALYPFLPGLSVPDGEVRVEAKVVSGHARTVVMVGVRISQDPPRGYYVFANPAGGVVALSKAEERFQPAMASHGVLGDRFAHDDWNSIAVRLDGPNLWVLLNDNLVLSASDPAFESGTVSLGVWRTGNSGDDVESAAVFRNLKVSALAPKP